MIGRPSVQDLLVQEQSSLRAVLEILNRTAMGIVFVVDRDRVLRGVMTDGDVRRAFLSGASLEHAASGYMKRDCVSLSADAPAEMVLATLSERIRQIPLLDANRVVVDYASFGHVHWLPVMEPDLAGNELQYVIECIRTNWVSSQGRFVVEFERRFEEIIGRGHALTVMNGTAALHLTLVTLGIGDGDEVLVPDLTFAASANAVIHAGGRPVLVDVDPQTWTIDVAAAETAVTSRTKAIMPVHLYGHPADMDAVRALAARHGLLVVEDAAEALGARYRGDYVGGLGDAGCFSFFGNKVITTGEGGMIVFAKREHWERARMLRDHGMAQDRRYWHREPGFNYRMTNLQAAIGVAQLERLDDVLASKRLVSAEYERAVATIPWLSRPPRATWADNINWLYTVLVGPDAPVSRDELLDKLRAHGIESRPVFFPLHQMPPYFVPDGDARFPVATWLGSRGLSLPSAARLRPGEIDRVADALKRIHGIKTLWAAGSMV